MNSTPFQTCNIEELIQVAPHAVVYLFHVSLRMFVTTLHWTSYCSSKTILSVAVYVAGLTVLERHQTQSRIARAIGYVSHDALNRLAEQLTPLFEQVVIGLLLLLEALTPGYLILDDVFLPKPFARYVAGAYLGYDHSQKRHLVGQHLVVICGPMACSVSQSRLPSGITGSSFAPTGPKTNWPAFWSIGLSAITSPVPI